MVTYFNSRPSARGDKPTSSHSSLGINFNSRPSARGDVQGEGWHDRADCISIHAPPRGATRGGLFTPRTTDFNSRPSARGDRTLLPFFGFRGISIHAPPRGATPVLPALLISEAISIHAPPRGATGVTPDGQSLEEFQFTPLREGRQQWIPKPVARRISIHAPPRGATVKVGSQDIAGIFQFTPLREGRPGAALLASRGKFQFTPLREGRRLRQNGRKK